MLQYDDSIHKYWDEKGNIPGISRILEPIADISSIPRDILETAATRGSNIHKITERLDLGLITEEEALDTEHKSYIEQYIQFLHDTNISWFAIERKLMDKNLRFAGRLDRIGIIGDRTYVIDLKTSSAKQDWWPVQLEAQRILASSICKIDCVRSLHLTSNGKCKLISYSDREEKEARECFLGLLTVCHWEIKHGKRSY